LSGIIGNPGIHTVVMPFYYTPWIILPLLSAVINGCLAVFAWPRRHVPAAGWFFWLTVSMSGWSLFYTLNTIATQLWLKSLFFKIGHGFFCVVLFTTLPMTLIVLGWVKRYSTLKLALLGMVPLLSLLMGITNDLHGLIRTNLHLVSYNGLILLGYQDGVYYRSFHILYSYLCYLLIILFCLLGMLRRGSSRRGSLAMILVATLVPLVTDMFNLSPVKELRLATSALFVSGICYWRAVFHHHLLSLVPLARTTLFEQMHEPVLVVDRDEILAELNCAAADQLELSADTVGRSLKELFPEGHPLHKIQDAGQDNIRHDQMHNRWWQVSKTSLSQDDAVAGIMLVLHDVTTLHETRQELQSSEERFRRLAEDSADMVWQLDTDLHFTYVNAVDQAIRGFLPEEVLGSSVNSVLLPEDAALVNQANAERIKKEQQGIHTGSMRYEIRMLCKDGSYIWTEVHANPLRDNTGKITGYIGVTRDISQRKQDEQRLATALEYEQEARTEQERFLDMIAHEYRTPLAIIQANIDLLEIKALQDSTISGSLIKMQRGVERLVDIFETSRRRKGLAQRTTELELEQIEAVICFRETIAAARDFWGDRFTCLNEPLPGCFIIADRHLLRTAVLNLLDNAIKYSPHEATVGLAISCSDTMLQLTIYNHSAQPVTEVPNELFCKYSRGSNSSGTSGTGVGLYLVADIARQFGGCLSMNIENRHEITTVLSIPLGRIPEEEYGT
jgi:PAS domain S-box-containing protein